MSAFFGSAADMTIPEGAWPSDAEPWRADWPGGEAFFFTRKEEIGRQVADHIRAIQSLNPEHESLRDAVRFLRHIHASRVARFASWQPEGKPN